MSTTQTLTTSPELIHTGVGWRRVKAADPAAVGPQIPIIDLARMSDPDLSVRKALAKQIYDACTKVGFFYVTNHGVPDALAKMILEQTMRFFHELTLEQKMKCHMDRNTEFWGYLHIDPGMVNALGQRTKTCESVSWGYEPASNPFRVDDESNGPSLWPEEAELPEFRVQVYKWMGEMHKLARSLLRLFALSLDLEEDYFIPKADRPCAILRLNHYPADLIDENTPSALRPHTDYELFTILLQDEIKSLEVVSADGAWVAVDPIPGTFVVNIGDAMSVWTNGKFVSTLHRVQNFTKKTRYSVPFFFGANYNAVLEAVPSCVSDENPAKYKPVTQREYLHMRLDGAYPKPDATGPARTTQTIELEAKA